MFGMDRSMTYRAENVKSGVCMKGTDFEHHVYWLETEGDLGTRWRYLTEDEIVRYTAYKAEKTRLDAEAAARQAGRINVTVTAGE